MVGGLVDTFYHTLDPKKRLTIPSEWRDAMGMEVGEKEVTFISSASPKILMMSLSVSRPIERNNVVTGNFFLRSM